MIQGVHAQSVVFIGLESVEGLLKEGLWRGPRGYSFISELRLTGSRPDRLVLRIGETRSTRNVAVCNFQLESRTERAKPVVKGTLEFTPVPRQTRVKVVLQGSADRGLLGDMAPTEAVRGLANEYARQVLSEVASRLESRAGGHSKARSASRGQATTV